MENRETLARKIIALDEAYRATPRRKILRRWRIRREINKNSQDLLRTSR